jgi:hypothetical protein
MDGETLAEAARFSGKPYGEGTGAYFAPDGRAIVDGSWRGHLLVRDAFTGEVLWEELEVDEGVTPFVTTGDRALWAYVRVPREAGSGHDRVCVRSWPFGEGEATVVLEKEHVGALAVDDRGELLALTDWPSLEVWRLPKHPEGAASLLHALDWPASSGTGEALDWHPGSDVLAYAGAGGAAVLTARLEPIWHIETMYPSDVRFAPDGSLLAVGDWSKGVVHDWPPR